MCLSKIITGTAQQSADMQLLRLSRDHPKRQSDRKGKAGSLTGVELQADKQDLRHDKPDGLKGLRGEHDDEPQHTHVDFPIRGRGGAESYQYYCYDEAAGRILQPRYKQRHHGDDWCECLRAHRVLSHNPQRIIQKASAGTCDAVQRSTQSQQRL